MRLWTNGYSTRIGKNDRVPARTAQSHNQSLFLIEPFNLRISVVRPLRYRGDDKRAVRASFLYRGSMYDLKVTDPDVEREFLALPDGKYKIEPNVFLTVSLTEEHTDGFCYKLAASILSENGIYA